MRSAMCVAFVLLGASLPSSTNADIDSPASNQTIVTVQSSSVDLSQIIATKIKAGQKRISLPAGDYYISSPISLTPDHSGLIIQAASDKPVTVSAGIRLNLDFKPYKDGIYQAQLPINIDLHKIAFDQLYIDGKLQHIARYPNYNPANPVYGGTAFDAISPERSKSWKNPAGAYVHALHRAAWGGNHWQITGRDAEGKLTLKGGYMNNRPRGMHAQHRFVEGIFEDLDAPNEWYLDRNTRTLYIYPDKNTDLSNTRIDATGLESIFNIQGSIDNPVTNITIQGITFNHTARTFMKTNEPLLRSDWMIHRGGAIFMEGVHNINIIDCNFQHLGGNAVFTSGYARNVTIKGSRFNDIGASAVTFAGRPDAVRNPLFNYNEQLPVDQISRELGPQSDNYPADCLVEDCLMYDLGTVEKQVAGLQISMAARITARHLSIYDVPRAGINVSEGTWGGHLIEYCDVFDTVKMTSDHGSFNSWGRDRFWHPKYDEMVRRINSYPDLIGLDDIETTTIRNSRWRCDHGWDIDLDDGSSNYEIYNNLCLSGGLKLREGFNRTVYNNILVNSVLHSHIWFANSNDNVYSNIFQKQFQRIRLKPKESSYRVHRNLLPNEKALKDAQNFGFGDDSAFGDPLFVDPKSHNYTVKENSPAFTIGYKNFDMTKFGVQKPSLKAIARVPEVPTGRPTPSSLQVKDPAIDVMDAIFKPIRGMGEISATGLDSERGMWAIEVPKDSLAYKCGLREGDVILSINGTPTNSSGILRRTYRRTKPPLKAVIYRNQQEMSLDLKK
ncbi:PDZ domain-containing protein [Planctomycetota bacterium]|nr:PDZ domain-containing protein [Planctomycetota bacterium]